MSFCWFFPIKISIFVFKCTPPESDPQSLEVSLTLMILIFLGKSSKNETLEGLINLWPNDPPLSILRVSLQCSEFKTLSRPNLTVLILNWQHMWHVGGTRARGWSITQEKPPWDYQGGLAATLEMLEIRGGQLHKNPRGIKRLHFEERPACGKALLQ